MKRRFPIHQRGAALLAMVAIVALGSAWYLTSRLNTESGQAAAAAKTRNTQVLNRAKTALIGYVAARAAKAGEDRPGALPCPEAPADFNDGTASEGTVSYPCTLPVVGRFPWRTLGLEKLVDAADEPLWYVVAPGWASANTVINSDCAGAFADTNLACSSPNGRLTVDGVASDVVALIISPGPILNVSASANCSAWMQVRPVTAPPDWRNYLECQNATSPADTTFATTGPAGSFNDQLVRITVGELLPAVEGAIAKRIEREIVPALNAMYTPSGWSFTGPGRLYPYAAPFTNPGTSDYLGIAGTYQGLLPFNQTSNCTSNPRCLPSLIPALKFWAVPPADAAIVGFGTIVSQTCVWTNDGNTRECTGTYQDDASTKVTQIQLNAKLSNVAMGLRKFDSSKLTLQARVGVTALTEWETVAAVPTATMNSDGSATLILVGSLPNSIAKGWGATGAFRITISGTAITDHTLLDTADTTTGWFARNEWFRHMYYATVAKHTAGQIAAIGCSPANPLAPTPNDCLIVTTNGTPANNRSAILILAGRSLNGNARPSAQLADYLEFGNRTASFESHPATRLIAYTYADTGAANAYVIPATVTTGRPFLFKVGPGNDNTGPSTLTTAATGAKNLKNIDGSSLGASQLQAGAVGEVTYDGTEFRLSKRPFNDRVVVVCPRAATTTDPVCP